jgi:hypothetical protein
VYEPAGIVRRLDHDQSVHCAYPWASRCVYVRAVIVRRLDYDPWSVRCAYFWAIRVCVSAYVRQNDLRQLYSACFWAIHCMHYVRIMTAHALP